MTTYVPPKVNTEFIFFVSLVSQSDTKTFQSNPTLATGDAKLSIDGGALANLTTLPAVTPASSKLVKITLSAAEMNGANITVVLSDASGAEWCDLVVNIQTSALQIDDFDARMPSATAVTNMNTVFATDFATNYDATTDAWRALTFGVSGTTGPSNQSFTFSTQTADNFNNFFSNGAIEAGSNDYLTAIDTIRDKLAGTGAVTFASLTVSGATTLTGAVSATSASNDIRGVKTGVPKNAALSAFPFFMVDSSDHISGKTGLTITATRSIDGAAFAACANSATEVSNGMYKINLAAADLNGDTITLRFTATGADPRLITIKTTP